MYPSKGRKQQLAELAAWVLMLSGGLLAMASYLWLGWAGGIVSIVMMVTGIAVLNLYEWVPLSERRMNREAADTGAEAFDGD